MSRTEEKVRPEPTIAELWLRPDLTLTEAVRVTGRSRETLQEWIKKDQVEYFQDGKYTRILTDSIRERSRKIAAEQSGGGR